MNIINIAMCRKPGNIKEVEQRQFAANTNCLVVKKKYISNDLYKNLINDFYQQNEIYEEIGGYNGDYTEVIQIVNKETKDSYYVNTEGYNYARYVGVIKRKNNKKVLSFETWFEKQKDNLIDLFCSFIKETKIYDCSLDKFVRHLYSETIHYKGENK